MAVMDWKTVVEHLRATALDEPPGAMIGETALPVLYAADFIERNAARWCREGLACGRRWGARRVTPNRERTYEAIYAAAFVREYSNYRDKRDDELARYRVADFHSVARSVAGAWLEMVQAAEGEDR